MSKEFCLLDEPWLPVRLADGRVLELGLLEVFERSAEIVALAETAPPSLVAHYRLLLAITHRALTTAFGSWREEDRVRWYREGLPLAEIRAYLEQWRERFWLFHPDSPFMQVAVLAHAEETRGKRKPWTQISLASASGNAPVLFDHAYDAVPEPISPSKAIGTLLGFLQFTPGGLVKNLRDADRAGALVNTAAVLPIGQNLIQTLCLALHPSPRVDAEADLPSWEREPSTIADLCADPVLATGPNDRYTRLSRAVLLSREDGGAVRWLHFAAGLALGEDPHAPDPMASFRAGSNGLVRLTFNEERAMWRDLPALVPNAGEGGRAAAIVQGAISLHRQLNPFETAYQPLLVAGMASDQAKLLRWRMELIVLPSSFLLEPDNAVHLGQCVAQAEALFTDLRRLAAGMLAETMPDPGHKDTRSRARSLVASGPLAGSYFAAAERALPALLQLISDGQPEQAETLWLQVLRKAAQQSWEQVLQGLGSSARALRADALFWPRLLGLLNKKVPHLDGITDKETLA